MQNIFEEIEHRLRGLVLRMKPTSIDDTKSRQRAAGAVMHGVHRSKIEVIQPFGFSSNPPPGSTMIVVAVGGDQGDLVGFPCSAPGARMGGLKPGEAAVSGLMG